MIDAYSVSARVPMIALETPPVALGAISVGVWGNWVKKDACETTGQAAWRTTGRAGATAARPSTAEGDRAQDDHDARAQDSAPARCWSEISTDLVAHVTCPAPASARSSSIMSLIRPPAPFADETTSHRLIKRETEVHEHQQDAERHQGRDLVALGLTELGGDPRRDRRAGIEQVELHVGDAAGDERDGDRLAGRSRQREERGAEQSDLGRRQDDLADDLPARRAEARGSPR